VYKRSTTRFSRIILLGHERGVGMLEVLIAILVISVGALGFAGIQLTALSNSDEANYRSHATLIAQDAIERFISNPTQIDFYTTPGNWPNVALASGSEPTNWKTCIDAECSAAQMAAWDVAQLNWIVANTLPGGRIQSRACGFNALECIAISWSGQAPGECLSAGGINTSDDSSCLVMEVLR